MWALALVDRRDHQLQLARDRLVKSPCIGVLAGVQGQALLFGSELALFGPIQASIIHQSACLQSCCDFAMFQRLSLSTPVSAAPSATSSRFRPLQPSTALPDSHPWWELPPRSKPATPSLYLRRCSRSP